MLHGGEEGYREPGEYGGCRSNRRDVSRMVWTVRSLQSDDGYRSCEAPPPEHDYFEKDDGPEANWKKTSLAMLLRQACSADAA